MHVLDAALVANLLLFSRNGVEASNGTRHEPRDDHRSEGKCWVSAGDSLLFPHRSGDGGRGGKRKT
jgi:hypothetical protein